MYGLELRARPKRRVLRDKDPVETNFRVLAKVLPGLKRTKQGAAITWFPGTKVKLIGDDGDLVFRAQTAAVGPGYARELVDRCAKILEPLELVWDEPPELDVAAIERDMCEWLVDELKEGSIEAFGIPKARAWRVPGAVLLTPMGPRDEAWKAAAIRDPALAADVFPWRGHGPGTFERARGLRALWHEVPWREPIDDAEEEMMLAVHHDLRDALKADPTLDMPWADWAALVDNLGVDSQRATEVREKAKQLGTESRIGYRRYDLEADLSGGWSVVMPGSFLSGWEDDGARFIATDGERAIEVQTLTAGGETDSAKLLAVAPEKFPVVGRIDADGYAGRAEATTHDDVRVVHGLVVKAPEIAIVTLRCAVDEEAWALDVWRSMRHRAVEEDEDD